MERELADRNTPAYPPVVRLANLVCSGLREAPVAALAGSAAEWLQRLVRRRRIEGIDLLGPAPCPIERIKGRWRWHLLVKARHAGDLTRLVRYFAERFPVPRQADLRVIVDRDPASLL